MKRRNHEINDYAAVPGWELMPPKSLWAGFVLLALKFSAVLGLGAFALLAICVALGL